MNAVHTFRGSDASVLMPRKDRKVGPPAALHQHKNHKVPNLYWRSVSSDTLRKHERYTALPPVAHLHLSPAASSNYRFVRQDSPLWRQLHDGMLTTGLLKQALGMHEYNAAAVVGIHPGSRGSSHLLSAYFHLLTTSNVNGGSDSNAAEASTEQAAVAAAMNEASRQLFNQQLDTAAAAAHAPAAAPSQAQGIAELCERTALAGDIAVKLAWGKVQEAAALFALLNLFPEALVEEVGLFHVQPATLPASWQLEPSAVPSLGASPDGLIVHKVSLDPQSVQTTAAALQQLQQQQQGSNAADCHGDVLQQQLLQGLLSRALDAVPCEGTRPSRGVPLASSEDEGQAGEGEVLGDSPDSSATVIVQSAAAGGSSEGEGQDVQHVRSSSFMENSGAAAAAVTEGVTAADTATGSTCGSESESVAAAEALGALTLEQLASDAPRTSPSLGTSSQGHAPAAASAEHGASSQSAAAAVNGDAQGAEGQAASSPDAGSLLFEPIADQLLRLLHQQQWQALPRHSARSVVGDSHTGSSVTPEEVASNTAVNPSTSTSTSASTSTGTSTSTSTSTSSSRDSTEAAARRRQPVEDEGKGAILYVREVVEVKSHCPFNFRSKTRAKKGRANVAFGFSPRGPAGRVQAQWIPQLQLHMLATGCQSALLVSRCPDTGLKVFRLWRDDAYLKTMLQLLSVLQQHHVLPGIAPKADTYSKVPGYKAFLHRTAALARSAVCIAAAEGDLLLVPPAEDGRNVPLFWS